VREKKRETNKKINTYVNSATCTNMCILHYLQMHFTFNLHNWIGLKKKFSKFVSNFNMKLKISEAHWECSGESGTRT
jgi:hypothetical protein